MFCNAVSLYRFVLILVLISVLFSICNREAPITQRFLILFLSAIVIEESHGHVDDHGAAHGDEGPFDQIKG